MAQPMLNSASEPRKRPGLRASVITMVLSGMEASTWPVCTMLSMRCVTSTGFVGRAALVARNRLERVFWPPFPDPCFPLALAARRPGLTQVFGHSRQVENH